MKKIFYKNYKNNLFIRFNLYNNISLFFFSNKTFSWYELNNSFQNAYSLFNKFSFESDLQTNSYKNSIINSIFLKKKFGFFKKNSKINHYSLYKLNFLKNSSFLKNDSIDFDSDSRNIFNKFVDLKSSSFNTFYNNRKILINLFFFKKTRQNKNTKILSKLTKSNFLGFIKFFEFSLINSLIRSKFCYTISESIFFIQNGCVYVNGIKCNNPFFQLSGGDLIQLPIFDDYFNFFKISTDKNIKLINSLKHIIWKNNRFNSNFYKQSYNRVPDWVSSISYFYDDVSIMYDVDYTIMTSILLFRKINFNFLNLNFYNFINLYMIRNYNWNYLT